MKVSYWNYLEPSHVVGFVLLCFIGGFFLAVAGAILAAFTGIWWIPFVVVLLSPFLALWALVDSLKEIQRRMED